ncbi:collagen-like protein [Ectopseudomonas mendocina]|uniref:Collagen-like protein n=1 Tax=Ectopseudomonas mendocina TaxID=300 RepID=A0ABZ2RHI2_ECTME
MQKILALTLLFSPLALAQAAIEVSPNAIMRLPAVGTALHVDRLEIADHGTLLVPAGLTDIQVDQLVLGQQARLSFAPGERPLSLQVTTATLGENALITARGAQGNYSKPATAGRDLNLRFGEINSGALVVDARGGKGAPGYVGLAGADGKPGGCTWGQATHGHDGLDGGDGQPGGAGAKVRIEIPQSLAEEQVRVLVEGGPGGDAGQAGQAGKGGDSKGCLLYTTAAGASGKSGQNGRAGEAGAPGSAEIVKF